MSTLLCCLKAQVVALPGLESPTMPTLEQSPLHVACCADPVVRELPVDWSRPADQTRALWRYLGDAVR